MKKKIVGILVCTLLIITVLSATGATNIQTIRNVMENNNLEPYTCIPSKSPGDIVIIFDAEVRVVNDQLNVLGGAIQVGDYIFGKYIYNSATSDSEPDPDGGVYEHSSSPYGIALAVGGFVFKTDPNNVNFSIRIVNDFFYYGIGDLYAVISDNNLPLSNGARVEDIMWVLGDSTGNAISSDALPTTAPVLSDWPENWLYIDGYDSENPYFYHIEANVTKVTLSRSKTRDDYFTTQPILIWLYERFPNLFPILLQILG
jgi:hypothetical protein